MLLCNNAKKNGSGTKRSRYFEASRGVDTKSRFTFEVPGNDG
jgi:hypothetical protein